MKTWNEDELRACLRRYKNDSLIAWHLGIPKSDVSAARRKLRPERGRGGGWISGGALGDEEYERRKADAAISNADYLAAIQRASLRG